MTTAQDSSCQTAEQSQYITGTTIVHETLFGDPTAVQNAKDAIYNSSPIVNQHLMGFGALNPEPYTDQYRLESLMERIGKTNGAVKDAQTIVLTACCAPDWMKGGEQGESFELDIELAPFPQYYDDYAQLVAHVVQQDEFENIKYIQVWNELKGFFIQENLVWDSVGYTNLYNAVYDSVKLVRPDIKIGGPYVPLDSWHTGVNRSGVGGDWGKFDKRILQVINYWLREKSGADFIVVDGHSGNKDGKPPGLDQWQMTDKFSDFMSWLRNHPEADAQNLPVWWAEWYAKSDNSNASALETNALMTVALIKLIKSGVETALLWSAQGNEQGFVADAFVRQLGLFSSTVNPGGGQATEFHSTQKFVNDYFSSGNVLIDLSSGNSNIDLLASEGKLLFVNKTNSVQSAIIAGQTFSLNPYEVSLEDTPAGIIIGNAQTLNCNYISNPDFDNNLDGWYVEQSTLSQNMGWCQITNIQSVTNPWDAKLIYEGLCLRETEYELSFTARSSGNKTAQVKIGQGEAPYASYFQASITLSQIETEISFPFTMSEHAVARLELHVGSDNQDVYIDNVVIKELACVQDNPCNLVSNSSFEQGDSDWFFWNNDYQINDVGECVLTADPVGNNPWDAAASIPELQLFENRNYDLSFQARSKDLPRQMYVKVGLGGAPWTSYLWQEVDLNLSMNSYSFSFQMNGTNTSIARIEFHIGGSETSVIIDNVLLKTEDCVPNNECELITNGKFLEDLADWNYWRCVSQINLDGQCEITEIEDMPNFWDCVLAYPNMTLNQNSIYRLSFESKSLTTSREIAVKVGLGIDPYDSYSWMEINLTPEMNFHSYTFAMNQASTNLARIEFQIGGNTNDIVIDNVSIVEETCQFNVLALDNCPDVRVITGDILSDEFHAGNDIISNGIILSDQDVKMYAGESVVLDLNFTVEQAAVFVASIQPCE